jgi:hypothetical protein
LEEGEKKTTISFGWYKEKERQQQEFQIFRNNKRQEIQSKEGPNIEEMILLFQPQNNSHRSYKILSNSYF